MENQIQKFNFNGNGVHIVDKAGEPWFVARDVCECLGLDNVTKAVSHLDQDEKMLIHITDFQNPGRGGDTGKRTIVNKPCVYNLIFQSRKPKAKAFKRWVTHEVLPQIEKTGGQNEKGQHLRPAL